MIKEKKRPKVPKYVYVSSLQRRHYQIESSMGSRWGNPLYCGSHLRALIPRVKPFLFSCPVPCLSNQNPFLSTQLCCVGRDVTHYNQFIPTCFWPGQQRPGPGMGSPQGRITDTSCLQSIQKPDGEVVKPPALTSALPEVGSGGSRSMKEGRLIKAVALRVGKDS